MPSRRNTLKSIGLATAALAVGAPRISMGANASGPADAPVAPWLAALGTSLATEHDYTARVEGRIPAALRGTLFRNGPGLFERDGYRKGHLLDGDGMLQAWTFTDSGVRFRNRFVRTAKFEAEARAGAFKYSTWGTRAPGGMLANLGGIDRQSQAGVTAIVRGDTVLAFDEIGLPYAIDHATLETRGERPIAEGLPPIHGFKAHVKIDGGNGDWIIVGGDFGRVQKIHVVVVGADGRLKAHHPFASPRYAYFHDFFATERYVVLVLNPITLSLPAFLGGMKSFIESLVWQPNDPTLLLAIDKSSGAMTTIEAPPAFMWHTLNAYEQGTTIVADFIGYDAPTHFTGPDAAFTAIMHGRSGQSAPHGTLRRYTIDVTARRAGEAVIDDGSFEFPTTDLRVQCRNHRIGYFATGSDRATWVLDGIARLDYARQAKRAFTFPARTYVGEPVFVRDPQASSGEDAGWLLAQGQDGNTGNGFLTVFDAARVDEGPLATVRLTHHLPISFHGMWRAV